MKGKRLISMDSILKDKNPTQNKSLISPHDIFKPIKSAVNSLSHTLTNKSLN